MSNITGLKLHGAALATCTRRVLFMAALENINIELVTVDFANKEHKQPQFLAMQPFGKVPVLDHNGFKLFESRAICRYIEELVGPNAKLIPSDIRERAIFEQFASLEGTVYNPQIELVLYNTAFHKFHGLPADAAALEKAESNLARDLPILDQFLSKTPYIAGKNVSLVDCFILPNLWALHEYAPEEFKKVIGVYPNISAWWKRITELDAWKTVLAIK